MKDTALCKKLGKKLRDCRGTRPAREIAAVLGVTQQALTGYERGRAEPDLSTLVKLAGIYKVTIDWLLGVSKFPCAPFSNSETVDILRRMVEIETEAQSRRMDLLSEICPS